ncbi:hypothetical protein LU631_16215 [Erwinia tracheiphila]|uniref:Uncharacterized protein n=1 Tax=Erwinia tracheiphila TaxID=65700 RepID=A0A0M2K7C0_9GAMM|nr:hypothetical protein [Erwinia tracheiphila]EOS96700.1 hypothetical protein ETR_01356 [Erwinia tracheiphila PSU-1]KKF34829.1 hypothetical protein SY86_04325 [Erwinia tracheiphila]UIA86494.1 hypothetical protein LU631_16215 [Erwinia tracheiphila]UIA94847.1 hypothetical protein LU633_14675 [Erwinia tracheiphila]
MKVSETALMKSGFSHTDLQKIKNNVESYGGTLEEVINDLARRFSTLLWVTAVCVVVFLLLVVFSSPIRATAGGLAIIVGITIMSFAQPPILSYKSWRYQKIAKG